MSGFGFRVSFPFCVVFFFGFLFEVFVGFIWLLFYVFCWLDFGFFWLPVFLVGLRGFS